MSTLDKVFEEVRALKPEELQRVRELVDSLLSEPAKPQVADDALEDAFERELMAEGVIGEVKPLPEEDPEFYAYRPATVQGKPLSETIVEERR